MNGTPRPDIADILAVERAETEYHACPSPAMAPTSVAALRSYMSSLSPLRERIESAIGYALPEHQWRLRQMAGELSALQRELSLRLAARGCGR